MRRLAGNDPEVNEEWITDKDRFAFNYAPQDDRLTYPQVRDDDGSLRPASWPEAFAVAARGLRAAGAGAVLTGGRLTAEDAYAYSKFARVALGTNDIDFRARPHSAEEAEFLAAHVVLTGPDGGAVTYADLETATTVVLVGFEPEDEAGAIFLRLRKAVARRHAGARDRAVQHPRPAQDERHPGADRARRRARRARLAGRPRRLRRRRHRGHPGRRAARHRARRALGRRRARAEDRRPAGLGAAPRR